MSSLQDEVRAGLEDRYDVEGELGRGGMAVVFLATDLRHGRKVAIKVFAPGVATGTGADRFQREIRTVAGLGHPHILPVLDSGEIPGANPRAWYAMPYVAGGSLRDRLQREGSLPIIDAVRIAAEAAEALDHAHRNGLVHRDVKPENVLLQDGQAVVADFGIADIVGGDPEDRLTATGLVMGTARYMSPEQATGAESLDPRTDVYSLGCVLYESLTGQAPFDAPTPQGVLARVLSEDLPSVTRDRPTAAGLDPVVAKALARLPADRFRTAGELAAALRASTPAQGVVAAEVLGASGVESLGEKPRGIRWLGWLGVAAVLGVIGAALLSQRDPPAAPSAEPSLVLLPLENLSPDPDDSLFAAGIREEIRTQLSKVEGIRLISTRGNAGNLDMSLTEIAEEWGGTVILDGSVRRAGDEVRMSFRLTDPVNGDAVWADSYPGKLSDVFATQTEVAAQVVAEIRGALTSDEREELMRPAPDNPEALAPYYAGRVSFRDFLFSEQGARGAAEGFGRAVQLDPGFVEAWTGLVQAHLFLAWLWGEPDSRDEARFALDRLEELAPGTTELRYARGLWLYFAEQRYDEALVELEAVAREWPQEVDIMMWLGAAQRRAGNLEAGARTWERMLERDPTNGSLTYNIASLLQNLGRTEEAERYFRRALELNPDVAVHWWGWFSHFLYAGDTARARIVMDSAVSHLGREGLESDGWWVRWLVYSGNWDQVVEVYRDIYGRDPRSLDGTWAGGYDVGIAGAAVAGEIQIVRAFAESIKARTEEALTTVAEEDVRSRSDLRGRLALAEAYLGNDEVAVDMARRAVSEYAATGDPVGNRGELRLAHVYAVVGRLDEAVEVLEDLGHPVGLLRISPEFDRLRGHPGFRALIEEGG